MTPDRSILLLAVLMVAACPRRNSDAPPSAAPHATSATAVPSASPAPKNAAWTAERVRQFVVETDQQLLNVRGEADTKYLNAQAIGKCYDDDAYPMGKASDIVPLFERRLTGRALTCYLATYIGCRLGDNIASAGIARTVPPAVPFFEAKTTIIEQTPDKVIADVSEAEWNMVHHGKLVPSEGDGVIEHKNKSRYTLTRDVQGVWKIADRVPSFSEWECREK